MGLAFLGLVIFVVSLVAPRAMRGAGGTVGAAPLIGRIVGIFLILAGLIGSTVTVVPAGHRGVLLRFGAVQGVLSEGIHFIVPQINSVELIEVRTQKEQAQSAAASKDLQVVTTTIALNYHVDPEGVARLFQNVGTDYRTRIIDPITQESLKAVTARYTAEELIRLRDKVKSEVQSDMTKRLQPYNMVVEPSGVSITNFDFSVDFNKAIEQKQIAQQTAEKQKYVLQQAELEAKTAIAKAKGEAESSRVSAQALQAQGGRLVLLREYIEKWDGKLPAVSGGGNAGMILDVRDVMKETGAAK